MKKIFINKLLKEDSTVSVNYFYMLLMKNRIKISMQKLKLIQLATTHGYFKRNQEKKIIFLFADVKGGVKMSVHYKYIYIYHK